MGIICNKILSEPALMSLFSGFIGSLIGSIATFIATYISHQNNMKLENLKLYEQEKSVALSMMEELRTLKNIYESDMDDMFKNLLPADECLNESDNTEQRLFIETCYSITQNFTTIYSCNADKIGLITNADLRSKIILTYTLLKKYIEELLNYNNTYEEFSENQKNFIARMYPDKIDKNCSKWDTNNEIDYIEKQIQNKAWQLPYSATINQEQINTFLKSNFNSKYTLRVFSNDLKEEYYKLKDLINQIINDTNSIYQNVK